MSKRKHISWKTKCAAAVLHLNPGWYDDAKQMTEDQFLSLWQWDHNILHETEHEDRDKFWNLAPLLIRAHRTKTKADAKIIAKSKRIRGKSIPGGGLVIADCTFRGPSGTFHITEHELFKKPTRKMQSRGFDKTKTKGFDGKVRPRK